MENINLKFLIPKQEPACWKKDSTIMTVLCFCAYCAGRCSSAANSFFKAILITALSMAAIYAAIHFTGLSVEIHNQNGILFSIR